MENVITKYAILTKRSDLKVHHPPGTSSSNSFNNIVQTIAVDAGNLIKIFNYNLSADGASVSNKLSMVQLLDYKNKDPIWENLYVCPQSHLRKIHEDLWPFVIAISSLHQRLRFTQNADQWKSIIYLRENELVSVSGDFFGQGNRGYDCIVRYIGPVQELGPVGYYIGLELLHLDNGHSPQSEHNTFSIKYMECDPSLSIFTTADWISPISGEVKSKFSAREIITDTIQRARSAINNCTYGPNKTNSLKRTGVTKKPLKKSSTKQATAQFYESINLTQDNFHVENKSEKESKGNVSNTRECDMMENKLLLTQYINSNQKEKLGLQKEKNTANIEQDDISQTTVENPAVSLPSPVELISFESEEFKQATENYEKNIERQYAPGAATVNNPSMSILKQNRSATKENLVKPLTVMKLDGRDIVVIDNADIKESTRNEANIIVVDKQTQNKEVDLVDLLGGNWPNNAGDAALVLNKSQDQNHFYGTGGKSSTSSASNNNNNQKSDRNKSLNLLTHINSKGKQKDVHCVKSLEVASSALHSKNENKNKLPVYDNLDNSDENTFTKAVSIQTLESLGDVSLSDTMPTGMGVGTMVEVAIAGKDFYGVIRWIGTPPESKSIMVGLELEDEQDYKDLPITNGKWNNASLYKCQEGRGLFVRPDQCSKDRRFEDVDVSNISKVYSKQQTDTKMFGQVECPSVPGAVPPLKIYNSKELEEICGKFKGIQGHHNSCYLDATLFSMFTFTHVFDSLLFRPSGPGDISHYDEVQKVLREEIVNPLRKNVFVRADRVMKLRQLLDKLSSISGLTSEEKDPEEFLNSLLAQIMRVEPFLKLSSGQDAYFYQLFVEKDERLLLPSVQQLFEQSFHSSDIKLKEVPSCLIIQMPRFGKNFKMYPRILPSQVLDVTDIIEDSPRQCSICGKLADNECRDCFGIMQGSVGLESTAFCGKCLKTVHQHEKRSNHKSREISVPHDFKIMAEHMVIPRLYMELFAVVCIETSHYVAFVKAGSGPDAPWCFFDSMADRKGEQNGYNIPEMLTVPDLPVWLSEEGARNINETFSNDKMLPEHAKRLFCDAYMCMYQSTDVMMYR